MSKNLMIKNGTEHSMYLILEYLGSADTREAKLFGKLKIVREEGVYYDTMIVKDKE